MIRKLTLLFTIIAMVATFSLAALAVVQTGPVTRVPGCKNGPVFKIDQPKTFNSQVLGYGVDVEWDVERQSACTLKELHVSVLLETAKGETLRLQQTVSPRVSKARFIVPASKVHIFSASDARLKITPRIAPVFQG